jgi:hypothetical protein
MAKGTGKGLSDMQQAEATRDSSKMTKRVAMGNSYTKATFATKVSLKMT